MSCCGQNQGVQSHSHSHGPGHSHGHSHSHGGYGGSWTSVSRNHNYHQVNTSSNVSMLEVSVIDGSGLPGRPSASLSRSLGYNYARTSGTQYLPKMTGSGAYSSYT